MDIQVRLSRTGNTQLFIGVYAGAGMALHEEAFLSRPGDSTRYMPTSALGEGEEAHV
ncbi:hypothetical protein [Pseudomonas putida]|uniref:hypothetical protein n=1 Tax=Pseudomonas putida TaxID=303 RepID=UPI00216433BB|nr:hypothetical protein [Pseudomonas putida]